jgi:hypothetical protein
LKIPVDWTVEQFVHSQPGTYFVLEDHESKGFNPDTPVHTIVFGLKNDVKIRRICDDSRSPRSGAVLEPTRLLHGAENTSLSAEQVKFSIVTPPHDVIHDSLFLPYDSTIMDGIEEAKRFFDADPRKKYVMMDCSGRLLLPHYLLRDIPEPRDFFVQEAIRISIESALDDFDPRDINIPKKW